MASSCERGVQFVTTGSWRGEQFAMTNISINTVSWRRSSWWKYVFLHSSWRRMYEFSWRVAHSSWHRMCIYTGCGPCQRIAPIIDTMAIELREIDMYMYTYVCMIYVYLYLYLYISTWIHIRMCKYMLIYICAHWPFCFLPLNSARYVCIYIVVYVYLYMNIYIYIYLYLCV